MKKAVLGSLFLALVGMGYNYIRMWKPYERSRALNGYRVWVRAYLNGVPATGWIGREINSSF